MELILHVPVFINSLRFQIWYLEKMYIDEHQTKVTYFNPLRVPGIIELLMQ